MPTERKPSESDQVEVVYTISADDVVEMETMQQEIAQIVSKYGLTTFKVGAILMSIIHAHYRAHEAREEVPFGNFVSACTDLAEQWHRTHHQ